MPRKRYKPEEIVAKLRQVDVPDSQGVNMADAIRQIGVSELRSIAGARSTARFSAPPSRSARQYPKQSSG